MITGTIKVIRTNMFNQSIFGITETNEEIELTLDDWDALDPKRSEAPTDNHQGNHDQTQS